MGIMEAFNPEKGRFLYQPLPTVVLEIRQISPPVLVSVSTTGTPTAGWNLESTLTFSIFGGVGFFVVCFILLIAYIAIKDRIKHSNRSLQSPRANQDADFDLELQVMLNGGVNIPGNAQAAGPSCRARSHRGGNRSGGNRRQSTSAVDVRPLPPLPLRRNVVYPNRPPPQLRIRSQHAIAPSLRRIGGNGRIHQTSRSLDGYLNCAAGSHDTLPKYEIGVPPPVYLQD